MTFFNRAIEFFDAQLLVVTACAWINIYQVNRQVIERSLSYGTSFGCLALSATGLLALFAYLLVESSRLKKQAIKGRVGAIYVGYMVRRDAKSAILTLICSIGRRFALGAIITFGEGNPMV